MRNSIFFNMFFITVLLFFYCLPCSYNIAYAQTNTTEAQTNEEVEAQIDQITANLQAAISKHDDDIAYLISELNKAEQAIAALEYSSGEHESKIAALETAYRDADKILQDKIDQITANLQVAISKQDDDIAYLSSELNKAKEAITALEYSSGEHESKIAALETAYRDADKILQEQIDQITANLQVAISKHDDDIAYLSSELNKAKEAITALEYSSGEHESKIAALETAYRDADKILQEKINTIKKELNASIEQQAKEINELNIEIQNINKKNNIITGSIVGLALIEFAIIGLFIILKIARSEKFN